MLKLTVYNYWRDANNYQHTCLYKIIHFSVQFSAIVNRIIVKTLLNSTFTNNLKRKKNRKMFIVADLASLTKNALPARLDNTNLITGLFLRKTRLKMRVVSRKCTFSRYYKWLVALKRILLLTMHILLSNYTNFKNIRAI